MVSQLKCYQKKLTGWRLIMSESSGITGFIEIFEGRLQKMKHHLKEELDKAKHERDRKLIRRIVYDARKLNKTLKRMRNVSAKKCRHCGETL
jgi:RNA polymerase-binding transcription factor DksA